MGKRVVLGVVAAMVACGLGGATAPVQAAPAMVAKQAPDVAVAKPWAPSLNIPASVADAMVANTPKVAPDVLAHQWASCELPINISYAAGPGVDADTLRVQLAYPISYLRDLGYYVSLDGEVDYSPDLAIPSTPGSVLIVAERDSKRLKDNSWRAVSDRPSRDAFFTVARVTVDAEGGMASDVILHEFGHVLGLEHKHGSVMDIPEPGAPIHFDAAETAAIDCRG